jgi:inosine-uridine nucleoside N-ribohydrolase
MLFGQNADYTHYIWDVIVSAIIIDPTLITEEATYPVDVCADFGPAYGQSIAYERDAPVGAQKARIIKTVDKDKLWKMVYDYCAKF